MARYFLRFRHSDTGLLPTFTFFKRAADLVSETPPSIVELASGTYYFDYMPATEIVFEADGGSGIVSEEIRYISDTISPRDMYVDEATSQVKDDVWDDAIARAPGTKGNKVDSWSADLLAVQNAITGTPALSLRDMAGAGFSSSTQSMQVTANNLLRALGMLHENSVMDQTSFNGSNNLLNGRLRIYDSKANADAALAASPGIYNTGKLAEYAITATYTGGGTNLATYKVSREA